MATITAQAAFDHSVRGTEVVEANFNRTGWTQSIQMENTMMAHLVSRASDSINVISTKDFPVNPKRTNPQYGITDGDLSATQYERYSWSVENYYHLSGLDITDRIDRPFDVHARLKMRLREGVRRLIAKTAIKGLVNPIKQIADGTVDTNTKNVTPDITPTVRKRHNVWFDQGKSTTVTALNNITTAYDPLETYRRIRQQFRKREVNTPLCILATPYLMNELEKFKGATNQPWGILSNQVIAPFERNKYNNMGGLDSFMWMGFRHVCTYQSHLPDPNMFHDQDNTANKPYVFNAKFTTYTQDIQAPMRDLDSASVTAYVPTTTMSEDNTAAVVNAKAYTYKVNGPGDGDNVTVAMTGTHTDVKTQAQYITYVWSPQHLNFVYIPSMYLSGMEDRVIRLLGATLYLERYSFGAYILDPDFYMIVALAVKKA